MKYLFYDCEGANSFNKVSKICSLGYVLCDEFFNIIAKEDLLINPEDVFDYHLFDNKSKINLHYPKSAFYSSPTFKERYEEIKALFTGNTMVIGFSIINDIKYLSDACKRYDLEMFNFKYMDAQEIHRQFRGYDHAYGLEKTIEDLDIDVSSVVCHKSDDDAYMTLLIMKKLFELNGLSTGEFLNKYKFKSYNDYIKEKSIRDLKKEARKQEYLERKNKVLKLNDLYGKSNEEGMLFKGQGFTFSKRVSKYIDEALLVQKFIYDNGGVTFRNYSDGLTVIIDKDEKTDEYEKENIKYITYDKIR